MESINNEDNLCWFSSAQPNDDTQIAMSDDIKPDTMGNQRTPLLQVEDFLNNSESNHGVEDEYGYTAVGGSTQGNSSENVYDTSMQKKDILILDEEVSQFFFIFYIFLPCLMTLASYYMFGIHCMFSVSSLDMAFCTIRLVGFLSDKYFQC